jgi:hypothetical protein
MSSALAFLGGTAAGTRSRAMRRSRIVHRRMQELHMARNGSMASEHRAPTRCSFVPSSRTIASIEDQIAQQN